MMTPQGRKAYDDLVTQKDKSASSGRASLTAAGLAALPFAAASFMAPAAGAAGGGVSSLAGIAPDGRPPVHCRSDLAASQIALGGIPGQGCWALGRLARVVSERSAGWGLRPRHFLTVLPGLTAPLSTAGSSAAASQLAMGGAPIGVGDIPTVPSVGGPVASIPEHTFLPVGEVRRWRLLAALVACLVVLAQSSWTRPQAREVSPPSSAQRLALLGVVETRRQRLRPH